MLDSSGGGASPPTRHTRRPSARPALFFQSAPPLGCVPEEGRARFRAAPTSYYAQEAASEPRDFTPYGSRAGGTIASRPYARQKSWGNFREHNSRPC